jgi:hypothetical protein
MEIKSGEVIGKLIFQIIQEHDDQDITVEIIDHHTDDDVFSFLYEVITNKFFPRKSWLKTFNLKG